MNLSKRQREILTALIGTEQPGAIPLYIEHIPRKNSFNSEREAVRFFKNLERRGLVTMKRDCFLYLTQLGASELTPNAEITGSACGVRVD